jgi:hypothetical protein
MSSNDRSPASDQPQWWNDSAILADIVQAAMERAVRKAIEEHHRAGDPVTIWRDGRIVRLYPDGSVEPVSGGEPAQDT